MGNCVCSPFGDNDVVDNGIEKKLLEQTDTSIYHLPKPDTQRGTLTYETKRAMAFAHFLANIWYTYVNITNKCEFLLDDDNMGNILQHIIIFGGAPRDYILGKEFDDIDMFLNTRELNKIHLLHLRKYHSKDIMSQSNSVKCCFWNLYANKYKENNENLNYQLNSTFFSEILINSIELKNKLSFTHHTICKSKMFMLKFLDDVIYNEYNLKGQDLDITDPIKRKIDESFNYKDAKTEDDIKEIGKLYHQKTMKQYKSQINIINDDEKISQQFLNTSKTATNIFQSMHVTKYHKVEINDINLKEIDLPIHSVSATDKVKSIDFSINTMVVFLSEIYDAENKYKIKYKWNVYGTIDAKHLNDGMKDLNNKLLRTPRFNPKDTLKILYYAKSGSTHFWRLVKFAVRYGDDDWSIDTELKEETIKFNHYWLNEERFTNEKWYKRFVYYMLEKYVKTPSDHLKRFKVMNDLEMHKWVRPYFKEKEGFRKCLLDKMMSLNDDHISVIRQLLKKYEYIQEM